MEQSLYTATIYSWPSHLITIVIKFFFCKNRLKAKTDGVEKYITLVGCHTRILCCLRLTKIKCSSFSLSKINFVLL